MDPLHLNFDPGVREKMAVEWLLPSGFALHLSSVAVSPKRCGICLFRLYRNHRRDVQACCEHFDMHVDHVLTTFDFGPPKRIGMAWVKYPDYGVMRLWCMGACVGVACAWASVK